MINPSQSTSRFCRALLERHVFTNLVPLIHHVFVIELEIKTPHIIFIIPLINESKKENDEGDSWFGIVHGSTWQFPGVEL